jgi:3'-5' exoribonuclease
MPQPLHTLTPGQQADFFAILFEKVRGATREGKPYFTCRFRNRLRQVTCMVWADSATFSACEREWREGQIYRLRAIYEEHERFGPQIDIQQIRPVSERDRDDGLDPAEMVESSRWPVDEMYRELVALVESELAETPLRMLVLGLLQTHEQAIKELPASERHYFPFRGGWLEHTLSVTRNCLRLVEHYRHHYTELHPPLNRDLVLAAAVLHEIGRVAELESQVYPPAATVPGKLYGSLLLGRDLIRDAARGQSDLDPRLLELLEHVVLTHLSLPEWGSPRLPMIPECLILHHADDLDAKMEMYVRCLTRDQNRGPFTVRDPLLGKPLLKDRR